MESTATKRVWHKGAPPFPGWWNASTQRYPESWRWWDGKRWSTHVDNKYNVAHQTQAATAAQRPADVATNHCEWSDYWPEDARVPRIDPAVGYLDIGDARWYLVEGQPMKGRVPRIVDSSAWMRWAEQRNTMAHPALGAPYGRTRMVDGDALAQLAMDAERLAERLRKLSNTAS